MSNAKGEVVRIKGTIKFQTTKAICFICDLEYVQFETLAQENENSKGLWFPFSQVNEIHPGKDQDGTIGEDELVVTSWIAKQKGIVS